MKYRVSLTARTAGALGINSEHRVYDIEAANGTIAISGAIGEAYSNGLENVVITRMIGVGRNGARFAVPAQH